MLPDSVRYALRAVIWFARNPDAPVSAEALARRTRIPRTCLRSALRNLRRASLVRLQSGPGGGYALIASPKTTTILDIINAVSPLERIRDCLLGFSSPANIWPLGAELDKAHALIERALAGVTIARLVDSPAPVLSLSKATASLATVPVVFACSGCSNAGQLANQLAIELDRRGIGEMSCVAGVGAAKTTFLKKIQGREVWVIDGCPIECGHGVFELVRAYVDVHIRLFDLGIRKNAELPTGIRLNRLVDKVLRVADDQKATPHEGNLT